MEASIEPMACAVCAGERHGPFAEANGCRLWRCAGCGFVFMHPPPNAARLEAIYGDAYNGATEGYFTKVEAKLRRSRRRVRRLARRFPGGAAGRAFLDVGCNGGFMTEAAREVGFVATGLDPDGPSVEWARRHFPQHRYLNAWLEEADLGEGGFDAIYCSEVIEHAADPNRFVARLALALAPGGLLYLTTPDVDHWRRPRDVTRWDAFNPPAHCVYFNPRNLARLLANHGLRPVWKALSFKPGIKLIVTRAG